MKHPTIEQLEKFLREKAGIFTRNHIEKHLPRCPECREKLEELREAEKLADELRHSVRSFPETAESRSDPTYARLSGIIGIPEKGTSA